jgi:phospholipid/cholesterol/gamma-HCH transport system ATP-binding protein
MQHGKREKIIEVTDFTAAYGDNIVIDDITFDIYKGEVFVIMGGSGCGKSTLLKHIIGLYTPSSGSIKINGRDIVRANLEDKLEILKNIVVTYQSGALFGSMTIMENVCVPLEEYTDFPESVRESIALMKLKLVGLGEYAHHMPSEISGGMQKRASVARAIVLNPNILFLDEPSAGLDPITADSLDNLILRLAREVGITCVIVSHELPSIYKVADRVIMLDKDRKKIVAEGKPADLRDNSSDVWVRNFFNRISE